jgi:hypothetical protein
MSPDEAVLANSLLQLDVAKGGLFVDTP